MSLEAEGSFLDDVLFAKLRYLRDQNWLKNHRCFASFNNEPRNPRKMMDLTISPMTEGEGSTFNKLNASLTCVGAAAYHDPAG